MPSHGNINTLSILGNTCQFVLGVTASCCHSGNLRCPWIQLSDCSADCLQYHIANTDFSHPIAGLVFWPELAYSPAEYLHCRLFFSPNVLLLLVCMFLRWILFCYQPDICFSNLCFSGLCSVICKSHLFPQENALLSIIKENTKQKMFR